MSKLRVGMVGFDISPRFHPKFGAWGTTPSVTELNMPLLARCIAFEQDSRRLIWFGSDLCGDSVSGTDRLRDEVAEAIGMRREQIIWSTSQTHSSGTLPGSSVAGGSVVTKRGQFDLEYCQAQRLRLISGYIRAAEEAMQRLQPANIWAGRGFCDTMSYNRRFPMPNGGVKFSRHHSEGLQSGKFFDPTIGLLRFDDEAGKPLGAIFNFCSHPATMINDKMISPDWVGTAREYVEEAIGGAPAMFVQGFCGDVNCHHIFGTPEQAKKNGTRLGRAAAEAMGNLIPVRAEPFDFKWRTVELNCRPMYTRGEIEEALEGRRVFIEELKHDPAATWFCGINAPEHFSVEEKITLVGIQNRYLEESLRMINAGETARSSLKLTMGVIRIGDVGAVLTPGENFTATGMQLRLRSPFAHTLICGDTNGLFGYIGDDAEIDRGGYETDTFWKMVYIDGFRLAPAKGTVERILKASVEMLSELQSTS